MNLYILRHGLAVERGTPGYEKDRDRPLTAKGRRRLRQIAKAMRKLELSFDLVLSSPYPRSRQTADIVATTFKARKKLKLSGDLAPDGNPQALIEFLKSLQPAPENVLLVGHEPYLGRLISTLVAGNSGLPVTLKKGGLCQLAVETLNYGHCAALEWLLTPKQMVLMVCR
jgi:phosphohistidine phosphatase